MKNGKRILSFFLSLVFLLSVLAIGRYALADGNENEMGEKIMRLYYDEPAELTPTHDRYTEAWDGWHSSIPLGNGYLGACVFGGTERERIQITEKSFFASSTDWIENTFKGGLENFAETYLDFSHPFGDVSNYSRELTLSDAIARITYDYNGVSFSREIFTSYPDRVIAIHLSASDAGALDFTLAPEIPYLRDAADLEASEYYYSGMTRVGTVVADADAATVTLSGTAELYSLNYEALYRVESDGVYTADNSGEFGKLSVTGATEATVYIACGTNYELCPEVFTEPDTRKKLDPTAYPHDGLAATLDAVAAMDYAQVRARHIADHAELFGRVELDLGGTMPTVTTDEMLLQFKDGAFNNNYIYELYYQIGRYFEIATSRDGTLPSNLMGAWCVHQFAPWTGGNWYNINEQMNYWGVFAANLTETFLSYLQFNEARMEQAKKRADEYVKTYNPDNYTAPGTNGWLVGTANSPYTVGQAGGHSGAGTLGMTTIDYWNYYLFTLDEEMLYDTIFTVLQEAARFYTKFAVLDENGLYLCTPSASPEQKVDPSYEIVGCAFDQQMMYSNNLSYLEAVEVVRAYEQKNGIAESIVDERLLATVTEQIDRYDPVIVGLSGQVKEYREEYFYGEFGDKHHRHISQLMGIANGTVINSNTPAWLDAVRKTLAFRGSPDMYSVGWGESQRLFAYARCGDAESSMKILRRLAQNSLFNNMWAEYSYDIYQIDSNFGTMAAISEMLLQSHEGYLNLLPALPDEFSDGSFRGMLARGNFTVDLAWKNGAPTTLTVFSGSGSDLGIYYPGYTNISVVDSDGTPVAYTLEDGVIRLATEKGETYTVTGFVPKSKASAPQNLTAEHNDGTVTLRWEASAEKNATYNIYRAYESAPAYEWIGTTDSLTFTDHKDARQATYCVRAYNDETVESLGATFTVIATPDAPTDAVSYEIEGGKLQLEWNTVQGCNAYRVYRDGTLVLETELPLAILPVGGGYSVSALYFGEESERATFAPSTEGTVSKAELYDKYHDLVDALGSSIFYDKTVSVDGEIRAMRSVLCDRNAGVGDVEEAIASFAEAKRTILYSKRNLAPSAVAYDVTPAPFSDQYLVPFMLDGTLATRYAAIRSGSTSIIVAELDLGGIFSISDIDIYEFADNGIPRSETTRIEFFVNGAWVEVLARTDTKTLGVNESGKFHTHVATDSTLQTSKVRVRLEQLSSGYMNLSIWELEIWGQCFGGSDAASAPVFHPDYPGTASSAVADNFGVGSSVYTDRNYHTNYMSAIHVGEALRGLRQIRLPLADSSRFAQDALLEFLRGDNVYFTFEAKTDGTVYVVFMDALKNYTAEKGWRPVALGVSPTLPDGTTLSALDPKYVPTDAPYYFTRLQSDNSTNTVLHAAPFTYCYALDFKAGDTVSIPTPAINTSYGLANENLVVLVQGEAMEPELTSVMANGTYFTPDADGTFTVLVPKDATSVTLEPALICPEWTATVAGGKTVSLKSDYATTTVSISDGLTTKIYKICILRAKTSFLDGLVGTMGSAHGSQYFASNDIPGNIAKMTDGTESTYLRVWHSVPKVGPLVFLYEADAPYLVDTFYISASTYNGLSQLGDVVVEGYKNGEWIPLTTLRLSADGVIEGDTVRARVTLDTPVAVSAIRFIAGYNSAVLTSDGTSIGDALKIFELCATYENVAVRKPTIDSVKVNGSTATYEDGKFYVTVDADATELNLLATGNDPSVTIRYTPSATLAYNGKKQTVTVTATNLLGESRTYTVVIEPGAPTKNVLLGKTPTIIDGSGVYPDYPIANLTDGNLATRMASYNKVPFEFEFALDDTYDLSSMTFYSYVYGTDALVGTVTVRGLIGGTWVDIAVCDMTRGITIDATNKNLGYKTFAFSAKGVSALRIHATQNPSQPTRGVSIWEIEVYGRKTTALEGDVNLDGFRILNNVTLQSSFAYNVYVPAERGVTELTLAGVTYELGDLPLVELEGGSYYKLTLPIAAKDAACVFVLTVKLAVGDKSATGTYTVSLLKYLEKLLGTDITSEERTLALDALAYARAAIVYFGSDEAVLPGIDAILDRNAYIEKAPECLASATGVRTPYGILGVTFSLDASVSFVVKLAEGYTAEDFAFLVGGSTAKVEAQGEYVYITVPAYRIKNTLTFTIADKDDPTVTHEGSYSLAIYYASDAVNEAENREALMHLVERLAAFCESADAYRASVIES